MQENGQKLPHVSPQLWGCFFDFQDSRRNPLVYLLLYYLTEKIDKCLDRMLKLNQRSCPARQFAPLEVIDTCMKLYPRTAVVECENDLRDLFRASVCEAPVGERESYWRLLPYVISVYRLRKDQLWVEEREAEWEKVGA